MRNLTIKRTKTFVGCLMKMKFYIEDPTSTEITIGGVPCRKLGELKSGKEMTVAIGDEAAKIFAIVDSLSKEYCNEFYPLPEGSEDIVLTGKNHFNPGNGNAFRFDNNDSEEVLANRKQGTRRGTPILLSALVIGVAIGLFFTSGLLHDSPKDSSKSFAAEGIQITLNEDFEQAEADGFSLMCESHYMAVIVLREAFEDYEGLEEWSLADYSQVLMENNDYVDHPLSYHNGIPYFEYDYHNPETKENFHYTIFMYKSDDAFWAVQFATHKSAADRYAEKIKGFAESVQFAE